MSASDDEEIPGREVAYRLFAAEYDDASLSHTESDEERAPNYVVSPTGARINRLFAVGTLTEVSSVNEEMVRARIVDPTGAFVVYAGQYQPDELATLESLEPPAFVAVTGKARTFEPDDGDRIYTSVRPESIATVDAETRDRWVVSTAEQTVERVGTYATAADLDARGDELTAILEDAGVERGLAAGLPLAQDHYGTTPSYLAALRDCALEAVAVVAGDRDQVQGLEIGPGDDGSADATFESLAELVDIDIDESSGTTTTGATAADSVTDAATEDSDSMVTDETVEPSTTGAADASTDETADAAPGTPLESDSSDVESADPVAADEAVDADDGASETAAGSESAVADDDVTAVTESAVDADETEASTADAGSDELDADDFDDGMYEMDDEEREQLEAEFGAEFTTGTEVDDPGESDVDVPVPDDRPTGDGADGDDALEADGDDALEADSETATDDLAEAPTSNLDPDPDESGIDDATDPTLEDSPETSLEDAADDDLASAAEADDEDAADDDLTSADEADVEDATDEPADDVDLQEYVVERMDDLDDGDGADRSAVLEAVVADTGAAEADVEDAIQDALMGGQCYEPDDDKLKAI